MSEEDPLVEVLEAELEGLMRRGKESGWAEEERIALFLAFDRWLAHPRVLDSSGNGSLRITVLNEITWLLPDPLIGRHAWEFIRSVAKKLGPEDSWGMREAWIIATFELAAGPPEEPSFLEMLFSLAAEEETRWAVFGAYRNVPWRLRPHARKYSEGLVSDEDCDRWLIGEGFCDDEILMGRDQ